MKQQNRRILACAVMAALGAGAAQADTTGCNSGNTISGWGVWCGVGSYLNQLTEEQPSAAGPAGENGGFTAPSADAGDSSQFGGQVKDDLHIALPTDAPGLRYFGYTANYTTEYHYRYDSETGGEASFAIATTGEVGTTRFDGNDDQFSQSFYDANGQLVYSDVFGPSDGDSSSDSAFNADGSRTRTSTGFEEGGYLADTEGSWSQGHRYAYVNEETSVPVGEGWRVISSDNASVGVGTALIVQYLDGYFTGGAEAGVYSYAYRHTGEDLSDYSYTSENDYMAAGAGIVGGALTPLDELQTLVAGNVQAMYYGNSNILGQSVEVAVNFGTKRFAGTWGEGYGGGPVRLRKGPEAPASFAFTAEGRIDGQHIVSESVSGVDSGFVQGAFFGEDAGGLGGAYQVTKDGETVSDVFATVRNDLEPRGVYFPTGGGID